ncbi:TetR/AcrR family transcriptional regulator [Nocardia sp. CA-151230]|uniref:TetR/AcrR family transcriptional regulator n=1 Tax=Nocardia sp. CA-151230 TaxID=3239982 RepID=UPI003D8B60EB
MTAGRTYGGMSADQRRADRRARLVHAARELLESGDIARVTVLAVCRRSQLSERYFYESFTDRDALLGAVYDDFADEYITAVTARMAAADDLTGRIHASVSVAPEMAATHPGMRHVLGRDAKEAEASRARAHIARKVIDLYLANRAFLFHDIDIDPLDAELTIRMMVGGGLDLAFAYCQGKFDVSAEELATRAAKLLEPLTKSLSSNHP